jgi:hypothetical protein
MTTMQLVVLRILCQTLCRVGWGSRLLRRILVRVVVKGKGRDRYAASGGFFNWSELEREGKGVVR